MNINMSIPDFIVWFMGKMSQIPYRLDQIYVIKAETQFGTYTLVGGLTIWDLLAGTMFMCIGFYLLGKLLNGMNVSFERTESDANVTPRDRYMMYKYGGKNKR